MASARSRGRSARRGSARSRSAEELIVLNGGRPVDRCPDDDAQPVSVAALLRREGRGPHAAARPLQPRTRLRPADIEAAAASLEAPPAQRRHLRKVTVAAGAFFALGAVLGPAILNEAGLTPRAEADRPGDADATHHAPGTGPAGGHATNLAAAPFVTATAAQLASLAYPALLDGLVPTQRSAVREPTVVGATPQAPGLPTVPAPGAGPTVPGSPGTPGGPGSPGTPGSPSAPGGPSTPTDPSGPSTPGGPTDPGTPPGHGPGGPPSVSIPVTLPELATPPITVPGVAAGPVQSPSVSVSPAAVTPPTVGVAAGPDGAGVTTTDTTLTTPDVHTSQAAAGPVGVSPAGATLPDVQVGGAAVQAGKDPKVHLPDASISKTEITTPDLSVGGKTVPLPDVALPSVQVKDVAENPVGAATGTVGQVASGAADTTGTLVHDTGDTLGSLVGTGSSKSSGSGSSSSAGSSSGSGSSPAKSAGADHGGAADSTPAAPSSAGGSGSGKSSSDSGSASGKGGPGSDSGSGTSGSTSPSS